MKKEMSKTYSPKEVEKKTYQKWQDNGYFKPEVHPDGKPFTIVMPPPNITGQLHMGHAFDGTLQDVLTRYKRMDGYAALWLPGTDHASIATEVKVVDKLREEEGKTKKDIGREAFLERAWDWALTYKSRITNQLKELGASCDWSRERFTMDEGCSKAVNEAFVNLYEKGLIYKGSRIINWCPDCKTALSEAEVEYETRQGNLWHIRYPLAEGNDYLVVATTRPETMLGDSGVAVNPNDERYAHLIGKTVILPLLDKEIPIVADDYVDMEFGTGVVKMTPAHDPNDYEVGLRHNLEQIRVMNDDGTMNELAGKYVGMDRYDCRKAVVKDLDALGLLEAIEDHEHNVGECYRCSTTVETMTSEQWFVKMEDLAQPALEAVRNRDTEFVPDRFSKIYYNWLENIRDWCISRQLWWGHRIPAYYCTECGEMVVSKEAPTKCSKCGNDTFTQDEDVLDTWFSSGLWPFSTLGWPENTEDLKKHYPTSVLVTGYDIIFFWVARMIFMGIFEMKETPFKDVYIHGLVRDSQGRKMSKSLGNGIDPLELIEEYSADALRFTIITGNSAGNDIRWQDDKMESSRNFLNKIWNAARFVLMNLDDDIMNKKAIAQENLENTDRWILSRLNNLFAEVNHNMEKYELGIAASKIYDFAWNEYCDWYIELVKPRLYGEDSPSKVAAQVTLHEVLEGILKLLHPFTPFITEEINSYLPGTEGDIIVAPWPHQKDENNYPADEKEIIFLMDVIRSIRNIRAEMDVPNSKKSQLLFISDREESTQLMKNSLDYLMKLASVSSIKTIEKSDVKENYVSAVVGDLELFIDLDELVDKEKEIARLEAEAGKLQKEIDRVNQKLSNKGFTDKAPEKVVQAEREKKQQYEETMEKVQERLNYFKA
ncbi:MAG: valyl-tRNA synthetase [Eubacteriaceae bacterium]|jgi:valyl-tRNA synthetase|nr:valyl-tRNA synthetase [Eubacteriaceae bacterium]MDK2904554.1 valyl-tRNA synthetase [Eubacteriaceae bacterium]MDK2935172.1 valyl-tRNA synthetase [Eubacteriaceae bacterium]MDN5307045.1 valyl-tRNA synthetase [Eubacteriaceae bacterium]